MQSYKALTYPHRPYHPNRAVIKTRNEKKQLPWCYILSISLGYDLFMRLDAIPGKFQAKKKMSRKSKQVQPRCTRAKELTETQGVQGSAWDRGPRWPCWDCAQAAGKWSPGADMTLT